MKDSKIKQPWSAHMVVVHTVDNIIGCSHHWQQASLNQAYCKMKTVSVTRAS
jgi:hypothetical protein